MEMVFVYVCELRIFRQVTEAEVLVLIRALPDKQCTSDPLPTWLLKGCADLLASVLRDIINQPLETELCRRHSKPLTSHHC